MTKNDGTFVVGFILVALWITIVLLGAYGIIQ